MKTYIEAHPTDTTKEIPVIKQEIGVKIAEADAKTCTEAEALAAVKLAVPLDSKTSQPILVKYYRHICDHDQKARTGCRLEEIKEDEPIIVK